MLNNKRLRCPSKTARGLALAAGLVLLTFAPINKAHAGSGELSLVYVNMTPDAESGGESSACAKTFRAVLAADEVGVKKLGETKTREAVGVPKEGPHFMSWEPKQFQRLLEDHGRHGFSDTALLIDCRPAKKMLDVLIVPNSGRPMRMRVRGISMGKSVVKALAKRALRHAWDGFVP